MSDLQYGLLRHIYLNECISIKTPGIHGLIFGKYFIEVAAAGLDHQQVVDTLLRWTERRLSRAKHEVEQRSLKERWAMRVSNTVRRCIRGMEYRKKAGCKELYFDVIRSSFISVSCRTLTRATLYVALTVPYNWYTEIYKADKALYIAQECGRCLRLDHNKYLGVKPGLLYIGAII